MSGQMSQLQSQVPYNTQLPYGGSSKHVQVSALTGVATAGDRRRQDWLTRPSEAAQLPSQSDGSAPAAIPPQRQLIRPTVSVWRNPTEDDHDFSKHALPSSAQSLDCQPFQLPPEATGENERVESSLRLPTSSSREAIQPFPLVEWIKRIRNSNSRQAATGPLGWAKRISDTQSAILDGDDAWLPPLAGRPQRSGTVPVEVLHHLTARVDQTSHQIAAQRESEAKQPVRKNGVDVGVDEDEDNQQRLPSQVHLQEGPIGSASSHSNETVDASQWSSSPTQQPRLHAPPDTSPVRPQPIRPIPAVPLQSSIPESLDPMVQDKDMSLPENDLHGSVHAEAGPNETDSSSAQAQCPRLPGPSSQSAELLGREPSAEKHKIHVKDTPYPRNASVARKGFSEAMPQSSFVGATYPDLPSPHTQPSMRKRTSVVAFNDDIAFELPSGDQHRHNSGSRLKQPRLVTTSAAAEVDRSSLVQELDHEAPVHKHRMLERDSVRSSDRYVDPAFRALDERRSLQRRMFRRSIATKWSAVRSDHAVSSDDQRDATRSNSSEVASSPALSAKYSHTSATDFSAHDGTLMRTPGGRLSSRRSSTSVDVNAPAFSSLFAAFLAAYPSYRGAEKPFKHAIQILLQLKSQAVEPHPSLWDDFVYRFAEDYDQYLECCRQEHENALPYQDFYHIHVKRSERNQGLISKDLIWQITESAAAEEDVVYSPRVYSGTANSPTAPGDGNTSSSQRHVSRPRDMNNPQNLGPMIQDIQATPLSDIKNRTKSRRSLPWTKDTQPQSSPPHAKQTPKLYLQPQSQSQHRSHSSEKSDVSTKVETWLLTSRIAGAASPELEAIELPTQAKTTTDEIDLGQRASQRRDPLPVTEQPVAQTIESVESPPLEVIVDQRTSTVFTDFAKNYADLSRERSKREDLHVTKRVPINICNW